MASVKEIMRLCRLCLVKDEVNTPIFDEQGDIRQIFLKISACLPVKVSREDNLPKNICDGCSSKLELLYQFWNTSANSEKKLIQWLGAERSERNAQHSMIDPVVLKQEVVEVPDERTSPDHLDDLNVSNDTDYLQQQLPYENVEFQFQQDDYDDTGTDAVVESPPVSRKRRAAAIRAMAKIGSEDEANSEDEGNPDLLEPKLAKIEEESEESGGEDPEPTAFVGLPSANDNDQPGPSGVGKSSVDSPFTYAMSRGIRKVNISSTRSSLSRLAANRSGMAECLVLLGDLKNLNTRLFRPTKRMRQMLAYKTCKALSVSLERVARPKPVAVDSLNIFGKIYQKQVFKCKQCWEVFEDELKYKRHITIHAVKRVNTASKQMHSCFICKKSFVTRNLLWMHMRSHSQPQQFKCKDCLETFKAGALLNLHRAQCPKRPQSPIGKTTESNQKESDASFRYRCSVCLQKFQDVNEMRKHKETHWDKPASAPARLTCEICDDILDDDTAYREHRAFHEELRAEESEVNDYVHPPASPDPEEHSIEDEQSNDGEVEDPVVMDDEDQQVLVMNVINEEEPAKEEEEDEVLVISGCDSDDDDEDDEEPKPRIFVKNIKDLMPEDTAPKKKEPAVYKCEECNLLFKKRRSYRKHCRLAMDKFKCSLCSYKTCSTPKLRQHYESEHNSSMCHKCRTPKDNGHICVDPAQA
uniref:Protein krueppel n=1 Tax=Photinus pyralis TaxID=7054 RepID=A0A1Y1KTT1_PHOPY